MDIQPLQRSGMKTFVLQENFVMNFEIKNLEVKESYSEQQGRIVQKISFDDRTSNSCIIGQSINIPTSWHAKFTCGTTHASVGLNLERCLNDETSYVFCKFRISIVDKDGDILYRKDWKSWEVPRKLSVGEDHSMRDFIDLSDLVNNQHFLATFKTLRLKCEGVLYSEFMHERIQGTEKANVPDSVTKASVKLWEGGMEFADFKLVGTTGGTVMAHKIVMKNASEVWNRLVDTVDVSRSGKGDIGLRIDDMSESEVKQMLQYIYTGSIEQDWTEFDQVLKLIQISETYELRSLKPLCLRKLVQSMTLKVFPDVMVLFQKYLTESYFREMMHDFLIKNQQTLIQMDSFRAIAKMSKNIFLDIVLLDGSKRT